MKKEKTKGFNFGEQKVSARTSCKSKINTKSLVTLKLFYNFTGKNTKERGTVKPCWLRQYVG